MTPSLLDAVNRLADVLERENAALAGMELRRAAALLAEKTAAFTALAAFAEAGAQPRHPELLSAARRLDAIALENRRLLDRAMAAQQRVIGIVARAAASAVPHASYGARGRMAYASRPMALSTRA